MNDRLRLSAAIGAMAAALALSLYIIYRVAVAFEAGSALTAALIVGFLAAIVTYLIEYLSDEETRG